MKRLLHAMLKNVLKGMSYVFTGLRLLIQPGIRRFVLIPLAINALLFAAVIVFGTHAIERQLERWIPAGWEWLNWVVWPAIVIVMMAIVFFGFSVLANLLAAPFNGWLAAAVESHLRGEKFAALKQRGLVRETLVMIYSELRKIVYIALRAVPCLLLFLIPGIQIAAPFFWFLLGAWLLALQYLDYPLGNQGLSFAQQRSVLSARRLLTLGFGVGTLGITLFPLVNFLAMPCAVAGATALWVEQIKPGMAAQNSG
ncbi:MAG: sulfate transporter CysZ [Gammaproteobacteria bacterium]